MTTQATLPLLCLATALLLTFGLTGLPSHGLANPKPPERGTPVPTSTPQPVADNDAASSPPPVELLRGLSQVEGLLRLGSAAAAITKAQELNTADDQNAALRPLLAWAYLATERYDDLASLLADDTGLDSELRFLRAAGLWRNHDSAGLNALRDLWWGEPQGLWGLAALRELAHAGAQRSPYPTKDAATLLRVIPPVAFDSGRRSEATPRATLETLRRVARGDLLAAETQYAVGTSLLVDEKFSEAVVALVAALGKTHDRSLERVIRLRLGEAERRRGAYKAAERYFAKVASQGSDRFHQQALALWGQMAIEYRRYDEARRLFEAQLVDNPIGEARHAALWGLGWVSFRTGDFRAARRFFVALLSESPFGPLAPRALYWGARAIDELGQQDDAAREMALLERRFPSDYYAYRALSWRGRAPAAAITDDPEATGPRTKHLRDLVAAQMHSKALREAQSLRPDLEHLSANDLLLVQSVATNAGDERLVQASRRVRARRFPIDDDGTAYLRAQFPNKWVALLSDAAKTQHLDVDLAAGVALTESRFNPRAVSPVGALGLMQLMPTTARDLLREENRTAVHADIFDPNVNTRLGVRYLGRLLRAFSKRPEYALAAYNAGPGAVTRWRESRGDLPVDIFAEEIPYAETRDYVQRVLAGLMAFRMSRDAALPHLAASIAQRD